MSKFIGLVSAYAYAKSKGYTGTEEEFAILMAEYASVTETAVEAVRIATESARSAAAASSDVNRAAATVTQQAAQVHDDAETSSESAATASEAKETAVDKALDSEAYALGTRDGEDVGSSDPAYHNNAKWYAESAGTSAQTASDAAQTATQKASDAQASASAAAESARTLTIDRTLTQSGQAADSKAVGDTINAIKEETELIFNYTEQSPTATATGWRLNESNGLCSQNVEYKMLKYPVSAGSWVKIISDDRFQFQTVASVPSSGDNYRVGNTYGIGEYVLRIPDTATYLIVSTPLTSTAKVFSCVEKTTAFSVITRIADISVLGSAIKHENEFYNINNQSYSSGQWDYYSVSAKQGDEFTINTTAGQTARAWVFRDASGNQLSIESYSGDVVQKEYENVVAPAGTSELIVNVKKIIGYFVSIVQKDATAVNESRIFYKGLPLSDYLDSLSQSSNILYGKTLVCCGDSITYGADMPQDSLVTPEIESYQYSAYTKKWTRWTAEEPAAYGYQIAARNKMVFYNGGVSGATVQGSGLNGSDIPGFSVADGEYTLLPENIDYLTLFYGWNDNAFGTLGTISDTTNDSYYGGYNVVLPYLINKYPYAKIAIIVPFGTDVNHRQAARLLANKYGIACFDMMQAGTPLYYGKEPTVDVDSSIVTANRAKYQANGAHPNYQGHYLISTMLEAFLRGI